ncbi:MAG: S-adenosylmethionine:tRNA ribosyltransferase-isomerase, partial [Patescibacteria group bacterium]|nr:S-adenosylmethionine:tRNA ribosyltransferase-isomerase [Patescibacteria group bacterium]
MDKNLYDYKLLENLLAKKPAVPRDFSKLFVYDTKTNKIFFDKFLNLNKYLPQNSFLVLNNTKVMPARVTLKKENGGLIKALFFVNEFFKNSKQIKFLIDKKINVGEKVFFNKQDFLKIVSQDKNIFTGKFDFSIERFYFLLEKYGQMPIPLYLRKTSLEKRDLFKKYQTIFAQKKGSIAAPTA